MVTYVILGFRLNRNNKIHPILKKRLDFFIKKYKKGDKVILSGGNPKKNTHTEAFIMAKYIKKHLDIKKNHILLENRSLNTQENVFFILKILDKHNINNASLITSSWHLKRVKTLFKKMSERKINISFLGSRKLIPKNKTEINLVKKELLFNNMLK